MHASLEIARTGLASVTLHPLRSLVTIASLTVVLLPFLAGLGLSKGLDEQAELSISEGADLYVTARQFGRNGSVPLTVVKELEKLEGVTAVTPRIVGGIVLGKDNVSAVLVGMPRESFPADVSCVEGNLPERSNLNELVVGTELARRLGLKIGSYIPPFYHNPAGDRLSKVVGLFRSDVSIWQARLIFTTLDAAAYIFNQPGLATDLLVTCRPEYRSQVSSAIARLNAIPTERNPNPMSLAVTSRDDLKAILPQGLLHREGIFNLHFVLLFVVGMLVILVTSGFGLSGRRREIGILKATGWQTDEVLFRSFVESCLLALAGVASAIVLAFAWLRWFNGWWIASVFLAGVDATPSFRVPFRLAPVPALLALLIGFTMVLSGTIYSSWRAATAEPIEAMR